MAPLGPLDLIQGLLDPPGPPAPFGPAGPAGADGAVGPAGPQGPVGTQRTLPSEYDDIRYGDAKERARQRLRSDGDERLAAEGAACTVIENAGELLKVMKRDDAIRS